MFDEHMFFFMPQNGGISYKAKKHIPGDTTAQIFWLKNRRPEYWGGGNAFISEQVNDVQIHLPDNGRGREDE